VGELFVSAGPVSGARGRRRASLIPGRPDADHLRRRKDDRVYLHPALLAAPSFLPVPGERRSGPVPPDGLAALTVAVLARPHWSAAVPRRPAPYWTVRLLAAAAVELWLSGWAPGAGQHPHSHDLPSAYTVAAGTLTDDTGGYALDVPAGATVTTAAGQVHALHNPGAAPALALHAYARRPEPRVLPHQLVPRRTVPAAAALIRGDAI
jgi:quercetin dioxygenase-like cupin family protein